MNNANTSQYILQSVDNSLSLIELLCDYEELSLAEMVSMTDYGKSSLFRMLVTLEKHKMVTKTRDNKYRLGYRLATIGSIVTSRIEITGIAHEYLVDLSARTKETTHLAILVDDTRVQFVDKVRGDSSIWMESSVGMTRLAHLTGTGKAQLAFRSEEQIERYIDHTEFKPVTKYTIKNAEELREELAHIREVGFACDKEESEEGLVCFAAPVVNFKGKVIAAVSISGFRDKMYARQDEFIQDIKETDIRAAGVIESMGHFTGYKTAWMCNFTHPGHFF